MKGIPATFQSRPPCGQRGWDSAMTSLDKRGEWVRGSSFLKGKWLHAEIIQKTGLGDPPPGYWFLAMILSLVA